jgi:hypothetical protein
MLKKAFGSNLDYLIRKQSQNSVIFPVKAEL